MPPSYAARGEIVHLASRVFGCGTMTPNRAFEIWTRFGLTMSRYAAGGARRLRAERELKLIVAVSSINERPRFGKQGSIGPRIIKSRIEQNPL